MSTTAGQRQYESVSCVLDQAVASALSFGDGKTFGVVSEVSIDPASAGSVRAAARSSFDGTYLPVGGIGAGFIALQYETTCIGGTFAYQSVVNFSLSNSSSRVTSGSDRACTSPTARMGEIRLPFSFGTGPITISIDTPSLRAATALEPYGMRRGTAEVTILGSDFQPLADASLVAVPEPAGASALTCGLVGIGMLLRKAKG